MVVDTSLERSVAQTPDPGVWVGLGWGSVAVRRVAQTRKRELLTWSAANRSCGKDSRPRIGFFKCTRIYIIRSIALELIQ
jgi:hypothetical protein